MGPNDPRNTPERPPGGPPRDETGPEYVGYHEGEASQPRAHPEGVDGADDARHDHDT
jgi:hypothetical protein